jgi:hypothetical protein
MLSREAKRIRTDLTRFEHELSRFRENKYDQPDWLVCAAGNRHRELGLIDRALSAMRETARKAQEEKDYHRTFAPTIHDRTIDEKVNGKGEA